MDSFMELAKRRESCRRYSRRPVEHDKLEACVRAASLSPSACNSQPWHFTVVSRPDLLPEVSACVQKLGLNSWTADCPAFAVVTEEPAKLLPRVAAVVEEQCFAPMDVGMTAAHFCLEAADLELGTCIMGMFDEERLKALLSLPEHSRVRLVIAVGYPAEPGPRPKVRRALEETAEFIE